jgi:diketogulonate reductase-like aldo/keto reductase
MKTVTLPNGEAVPSLCLGTWHVGEAAGSRRREIAAVRLALELGYRAIDSAEMYGEGGAEEVVGQALAEALRAGSLRREDVFIVSKVYPHNASRGGTVAACERSLQRLQLEQIDLYLLHWRGQHALADTVAAFEHLRERGRIRHWGVSNFDTADLRELAALPGGATCVANQVYYSLSERGVEFELLPWQRARQMLLMAYSPLDEGRLARHGGLQRIAERRGLTAAQLALAWLLAQAGVMTVAKAVSEAHLRENYAAGQLKLTAQDMKDLECEFPAPRRRKPLAMR